MDSISLYRRAYLEKHTSAAEKGTERDSSQQPNTARTIVFLFPPSNQIHPFTCNGRYRAYSSRKSWSWWLTQSSQRPSTNACPIAMAWTLEVEEQRLFLSLVLNAYDTSGKKNHLLHWLLYSTDIFNQTLFKMLWRGSRVYCSSMELDEVVLSALSWEDNWRSINSIALAWVIDIDLFSENPG